MMTAIKHNIKVVKPIINIEDIILTFRTPKLIPTAKASILVGIARINNFFTDKSSLSHCITECESLDLNSFI